MLNIELNDHNIPHQTKIYSEIMDLWCLHIYDLGKKNRGMLFYYYSLLFYLLTSIVRDTQKFFIYN